MSETIRRSWRGTGFHRELVTERVTTEELSVVKGPSAIVYKHLLRIAEVVLNLGSDMTIDLLEPGLKDSSDQIIQDLVANGYLNLPDEKGDEEEQNEMR